MAQATKVTHDLAIQARADMEIRAPVPSLLPKGLTRPVVYAISKRSVAEGQMLKQGDPVAELVIENPLRLWSTVPERFSAEITLGQVARVTVSAYTDRAFEGKVARINPTIDPTSRTFQVEVAVPNGNGLLRPGGFAKASILTHSNSEALTVPIESVVHFAGVSKVFLVENDQAKEVKVETRLEGPGWVEVVGKLPPAGQVVTSGQTQLADGTAVAIRKAETEPALAAGKKL
jgi:RND family efflux transporter MFP subunit